MVQKFKDHNFEFPMIYRGIQTTNASPLRVFRDRKMEKKLADELLSLLELSFDHLIMRLSFLRGPNLDESKTIDN